MSDTRDRLQETCRRIEATLPPGTGFVLMAFDFNNPDATLEYASNAKREGVLAMLETFLDQNKNPENWMKHLDDGPKPPGL